MSTNGLERNIVIEKEINTISKVTEDEPYMFLGDINGRGLSWNTRSQPKWGKSSQLD